MADKKLGPREVFFLALILIISGFLITYDKGVVRETRGSEMEKIARACESLSNRESCYAKAFENLTKTTDRDRAFEVLRELQKVDAAARGCHFIAHAISTAETQKNPSRWKELMNSAPPDCSYGAAHGALEVYASTFPEGKIPEEEIPSLCNNPDLNNCTHALGHLLLVINENDIERSTATCHTLPHDSRAQFECLTGVFMERITAINLEIHGLAAKEALNWPARVPELEALCREQTNVESIACWKEIVHAVLIKVRNDPQAIIDFCETAPGERETRECIDHSLGIIAAGYNFQLANMHPICEAKAKASDYQNRCYAHLVSSTLSTVPQEIPSAVSFCNSVETIYQQECFTMIGNSLRGRGPELRPILATECNKVAPVFRELCELGGNSEIKLYSGD